MAKSASTTYPSHEEAPSSSGGAPAPREGEIGPREGEVGLGVDIVDIARMRAILKRTPAFKERVFTEAERAYCESTPVPEAHYATRFAAKEAVVKALGTGFSQGIWVRDVEVVRGTSGRPRIALTGRAKERAAEIGVRDLPVSLSFTHTEAVACVIAITQRSLSAAEQRKDPTQELVARFKEARTLLDDPAFSKADTGN